MTGNLKRPEKLSEIQNHSLPSKYRKEAVDLGGGSIYLEMATDPEREADSSLSSTAKRRLSCTTCFDALWFCYSPVHQMQQYYRLGLFDNCSQKWSDLVDCLTLKTKRSSQVQEILEAREKAKPHLWKLRTPEEASVHWRQLFGHLDDEVE